MSDVIGLELGQVCVLTLNRPDKQNAMTLEMAEAIRLRVSQINQHADARLVLVRGAGRAFCAGGDFEMLGANAARSAEENREGMLYFYRSFLGLLELRVPSVAVVHGAAVGAGLCVAMACDLRLAATEAKLGANFVKVGLHPGMGCSVLLPRLVGPSKAAELLMTGSLIRGDEAARIGLVSSAVPRAQLEELVDTTREQLLAAAPIALRQLTETLRGDLIDALGPALRRESSCQAIDFTTLDLKEAVSAFGEGRPPRFTGQ